MIWLFMFSMLMASERLDPHGVKNQDLRSVKNDLSCLVCHKELKNYHLYQDYKNRCSDCHNVSPHSGVKEHKSLNCLSCHRAHRAELKGEQGKDYSVSNESSFVIKFKHDTDKSQRIEKSHMPMLKKTCRECHGDILK